MAGKPCVLFTSSLVPFTLSPIGGPSRFRCYVRPADGGEVAAQLPATLLILHNLQTQDLFAIPGWRVGVSWILVTVSYSLLGFATVVVGVLGKSSLVEYTLIPNL